MIGLPPMGLGVFDIADEDVAPAVHAALEAGYRLIDTAEVYRNEEAVGAAIRDSGVAREEIAVVSKIWALDLRPLSELVSRVERSADRLGAAPVDLFLVHWPGQHGAHVNSYESLALARERGLVREIGVSNYLPRHLDDLAAAGLPTPAANQIERHPFHAQDDVRRANDSRGIPTMAWSPLGRGRLFEEASVREIADRVGRSAAQVALRWNLQRGVTVLPKSKSPERIAQNAQILDFQLAEDDLARLDALDEGASIDPSLAARYQ